MSRFALLPVDAISDRRLTLVQLRVFAALCVFAGRDGRCWPTRPQLAEMAGVPEAKVTAATTALAALGWLEKTPGAGRSRSSYRVLGRPEVPESVASHWEAAEVPNSETSEAAKLETAATPELGRAEVPNSGTHNIPINTQEKPHNPASACEAPNGVVVDLEELNPEEQAAAGRLLAGIEEHDSAALVGELKAQMARGGVRNPVAYLRRMVDAYRRGNFMAEATLWNRAEEAKRAELEAVNRVNEARALWELRNAPAAPAVGPLAKRLEAIQARAEGRAH